MHFLLRVHAARLIEGHPRRNALMTARNIGDVENALWINCDRPRQRDTVGDLAKNRRRL